MSRRRGLSKKRVRFHAPPEAFDDRMARMASRPFVVSEAQGEFLRRKFAAMKAETLARRARRLADR